MVAWPARLDLRTPQGQQTFGQFMRQAFQQGRNRIPQQGAAPAALAPSVTPNNVPPVAQNMDAPAPQMSKRRSLLTAQASMGGRYGKVAKDLLG
jgi:hypothetical protein